MLYRLLVLFYNQCKVALVYAPTRTSRQKDITKVQPKGNSGINLEIGISNHTKVFHIPHIGGKALGLKQSLVNIYKLIAVSQTRCKPGQSCSLNANNFFYSKWKKKCDP